MEGPSVWGPPYYWFSEFSGPAGGSSAGEGENEPFPPRESLKKFIPADHLWPPDDYWYFHAGGNEAGNNTLANIRRAIDQRHGPTNNLEELAKKPQLSYYEPVHPQYATYPPHCTTPTTSLHDI